MNLQKHVSLNLNVRGLSQSATLDINDRSKQAQREGKTVYRLGLGQSPFPVPLPVVEALQLHAHEKDYLPSTGLRELREAVADFHRRKDGVEARPQDVLIGPGSKELMFLLQVAYYGELIVPTPCWVSYVPQATILGRKVSLMRTRGREQWKITAAGLEWQCAGEHDEFRPRLLVLNYPSNPVGCSYTETELKELAEVARKFEVLILSDEIYGQLHHKGAHMSIARFYPEGTIISSGLSKWCGAGGWRLGTFTFPPDLDWLLEAMAVLASETYTSVCAPIQYAAITAFRGGSWMERYLWHTRRVLAAVGQQCARMLSEAEIRVHDPVGAFYLFLDFSRYAERLSKRGMETGEQLCERLFQDTGVAILPGLAFQRPEEELTARLAYIDFDGAKTLTASETIPLDQTLPPDFTKLWCDKVFQATRIIIDWIKG